MHLVLVASLYDVNGKPVWTSGSINGDALNGKKVMVNQFGSGLYYLKITDAKGAMLGAAKVSITKYKFIILKPIMNIKPVVEKQRVFYLV